MLTRLGYAQDLLDLEYTVNDRRFWTISGSMVELPFGHLPGTPVPSLAPDVWSLAALATLPRTQVPAAVPD